MGKKCVCQAPAGGEFYPFSNTRLILPRSTVATSTTHDSVTGFAEAARVPDPEPTSMLLSLGDGA